MTVQRKELLSTDLKVINIGLELFAESLSAQSISVMQVAWKPAVELEPDIKDILDDLL